VDTDFEDGSLGNDRRASRRKAPRKETLKQGEEARERLPVLTLQEITVRSPRKKTRRLKVKDIAGRTMSPHIANEFTFGVEVK